jgi:hypothetical protein
MDDFDIESFVDQLIEGEFDGRVQQMLRELSYEQLEAVARLISMRLDAGDFSGKKHASATPAPWQ